MGVIDYLVDNNIYLHRNRHISKYSHRFAASNRIPIPNAIEELSAEQQKALLRRRDLAIRHEAHALLMSTIQTMERNERLQSLNKPGADELEETRQDNLRVLEMFGIEDEDINMSSDEQPQSRSIQMRQGTIQGAVATPFSN